MQVNCAGQAAEIMADQIRAVSISRFFKRIDVLGKGEIPYASAASALAMDEGAVRVAVHRLRKRYRELLRRKVADTLADPAMVDEELALLLGAFG
jgi:RNA polymerase sigma-70 factor (ECF subfamily)